MNKRDFIKSLFAAMGAAVVPGAVVAGDFFPDDQIGAGVQTDAYRLVYGGHEILEVIEVHACADHGDFKFEAYGHASDPLLDAFHSVRAHELQFIAHDMKLAVQAYVRDIEHVMPVNELSRYTVTLRCCGAITMTS